MSARVLDHDWYDRPLPDNVALGPRSWIHSSYAFLHYRSTRPTGLRLGADSGIYIGSMLEVGPDGEVDVGRYCAVGGAIFRTNTRITIGDYALISWDVVFSTAATDSPLPPSADRVERDAGQIVLGDNVWVGARVLILGDVEIGDDAVIGAGAVVRESVPAGAVVAGNPARVVGAVPRDAA